MFTNLAIVWGPHIVGPRFPHQLPDHPNNFEKYVKHDQARSHPQVMPFIPICRADTGQIKTIKTTSLQCH